MDSDPLAVCLICCYTSASIPLSGASSPLPGASPHLWESPYKLLSYGFAAFR